MSKSSAKVYFLKSEFLASRAVDVLLHRRVGVVAALGVVEPDVVVDLEVALALLRLGLLDEDHDLVVVVAAEDLHLGRGGVLAGLLGDDVVDGAVVLLVEGRRSSIDLRMALKSGVSRRAAARGARPASGQRQTDRDAPSCVLRCSCRCSLFDRAQGDGGIEPGGVPRGEEGRGEGEGRHDDHVDERPRAGAR